MKKDSTLTVNAARLLTGVALSAVIAGNAAAQVRDEIVVTSQRTEQSLQDVPISVTAFSGGDLDAQQIESFNDIQMNTPNFSFTRSQFTGSTIVIRGVGALAVGADSEPALSIHMNDLPLDAPRLFETEFFDVERIEVLRGPQGTLFGRNATGGVVNVITAKANPDGVEAHADVEVGNYSSVKFKGALNLPVSDTLALRVAGTTINRDGYTTNEFDGSDVDDRNIWAVRGSLRWYPTDNTTVDVTVSHMREDDSRLRHSNTTCTRDPSGVRGCLPGIQGNDQPHLAGTTHILSSAETFETLGGLLGSPGLGAFGLFSVAGDPNLTQPARSADNRVINTNFNPIYNAEETIFMANIRHDFDNFSVKLTGGYGDSRISQFQDQLNDFGAETALSGAMLPLVLAGTIPITYNALYADGLLPVSGFDEGSAGFIGGNILQQSNTFSTIEQSIGQSDYWSIEGIGTSNFDGPFNFLLGASYSSSEGFADFYTSGNSLDYLSAVLASVGFADGTSIYAPYFRSDGSAERKSTSVFGEIYVDLSDTLRFTGGVRYNHDEKSIQDRALLLDSFLALAGGDPGLAPPFGMGTAPVVVPLGTTDVTAGLDVINPRRVDTVDFDEFTGRAVLDWQMTDNALLYLSYSRGYKPGGFNAPASVGLGVQPTYEPEFINAYEIGLKSNLFEGVLQANLTGFYYDYSGLQVSKIINRTSVNENVDATIWGVEGEFILRPTDNLRLNSTVSYLNTEIGEFMSFDPGNPTAGDPDADLFKDLTNAANCVVRNNGAPSLIGQLANPLAPAGPTNPLITPFTVCDAILEPAIAARNGLLMTNYELLAGIEQNLEGNRLPGAPEFSFSVGAEYTFPMGTFAEVTPRIDYYWQDDFYTRVFNTDGDLVEGWDVMNAQVTVNSVDGPWYVRFFMQNVLNDEQITGQYLQDQSAGLITNIFLQEPRRYGVAVGARF
ncbi:TonB-dependent receptor [Hyphococcus flavus]|uniref:TonB-dependent receptor n=1 Tax=Hyphococcus flavus TaxID=1866326 RepID=A0AAE9ZFU0_9PROT|nr:TonB-dependent receptor [Hyphococcus flavus]WDI30036.1 TonB-dependent receptor [Hyphococcus flavus]